MKLALPLGLVLASAPAFADATYKRDPQLRIDVARSERTRPLHAAPPAAAGPVVTADDLVRTEEVTQTYRKEQEAILEKLIADTPDDDPDKPDLMFRLAEHYAKQHRFWRLQSIAPTMPGAKPAAKVR